ncbi:helix-turn-helix domain-containing protein [Variovorax sp. LT1R16]|uniref:helix-turn-helix domain-containing protein n=1 Tax=Variovorax sp. LT1R16 TaxID=3443728 RepID=UPI003F461642
MATTKSQPDKNRNYASVRSCQRGLSLLEVISLHRSIRLKDLVRETALPRATVVRLVETLVDCGYVTENHEFATLELAPRVLNLANGFHFENWLETVSAPILLELIEKIGWPSDVMFLYGDRMRARASNRMHCAMEINRNFVGVGGPLWYSAAGRAYVAWCSEMELDRLLHQSAPLPQHKGIRRELALTRERGYSIRDPGIEATVGAIAVPVMFKGTVACTLTCIFIHGAVTNMAVAEKCLEPLRKAAERLELAYQGSFQQVQAAHLQVNSWE